MFASRCEFGQFYKAAKACKFWHFLQDLSSSSFAASSSFPEGPSLKIQLEQFPYTQHVRKARYELQNLKSEKVLSNTQKGAILRL